MNKQYEIELWFATKLQSLEVNSDVPIFARKKALSNLQTSIDLFYKNTEQSNQNKIQITDEQSTNPKNSKTHQISFQSFDKKEIDQQKNKTQQIKSKFGNETKMLKTVLKSEVQNAKKKSNESNLPINPNPKTSILTPTVISFQHFPMREVDKKDNSELVLPKNTKKTVINLQNVGGGKEVIVTKTLEKAEVKVEKKVEMTVIVSPEERKTKATSEIKKTFTPKLELTKYLDLQNNPSSDSTQTNLEKPPTIISFAHLPIKKTNLIKKDTNPSFINLSKKIEAKSKIQLEQNQTEINQCLDQGLPKKIPTKQHLSEHNLEKLEQKVLSNPSNNHKIIIPMIDRKSVV